MKLAPQNRTALRWRSFFRSSSDCQLPAIGLALHLAIHLDRVGDLLGGRLAVPRILAGDPSTTARAEPPFRRSPP